MNYLTKPIFEMHEFPEYLATFGHEVGFVQFPEGQRKNQRPAQNPQVVIKGRVLPDARLTLFTPWTLSMSGVNRLVAAVTIFFQFRAILKNFAPDIVVSYAVPTSGWQALNACRLAQIPFVFRALDVSHKIRPSWFAPLILMAEKFIYRNSDWLSANNAAMKKYCESLGAKPEKTSVELPPLHLEHFDVERDEKLRASLGFESNSRVFLYMGTFFYFSGLPDLIRKFAEKRLEGDYLLLVGGGDQERELIELVKTLRIQKFVVFTGFVDFDKLPSYLSVADVALNPMQPSLVSNAAIPNKVIQYLAAGLPVVSTRLDGLQATFVEGKSIAYADSPSDVFPLAQQILGNSQESNDMSARKGIVKKLFDVQESVTRFEEMLREVVDSRLQ